MTTTNISHVVRSNVIRGFGNAIPCIRCQRSIFSLTAERFPAAKVNRKLFSHSTRASEDSIPFKKYGMAQPRSSTDEPREPKMIRKAYVALGSNIGDRVAWIEQACKEMDMRGIKVTRTSSLWETEPMYVLDQDKFVNGACEVSFYP
jgi:2-amino-4-hydroxy-6-hydroxymethyldihydropteridine diphosphokinase/dihydropteroate synthase